MVSGMGRWCGYLFFEVVYLIFVYRTTVNGMRMTPEGSLWCRLRLRIGWPRTG
jgi:hypothetical protein